MMKLDVPYYSQWLDIDSEHWRPRSCGICALKMTMDFLDANSGSPAPDDLIKRALAIPGAYSPQSGWVHDGLLSLAKQYGFASSFRMEWPEGAGAEDYISGLIAKGIPVIASVQSPSGGHLTLLTGVREKAGEITGFYMNDPDSRDRLSGKDKFIPIADFLALWKRRIIIIKK